VAIVFILFSARRDQPTWITEAKSYPILKQTQCHESLMPLNPSNICLATRMTRRLPACGAGACLAHLRWHLAPAPDQRSEGPIAEPVA
jgi:hypothetical protein